MKRTKSERIESARVLSHGVGCVHCADHAQRAVPPKTEPKREVPELPIDNQIIQDLKKILTPDKTNPNPNPNADQEIQKLLQKYLEELRKKETLPEETVASKLGDILTKAGIPPEDQQRIIDGILKKPEPVYSNGNRVLTQI